MLEDSLNDLRQSFTATDAQQHTIDTVEQVILTLMEKKFKTGSSFPKHGQNQVFYCHYMYFYVQRPPVLKDHLL